MSEDTNTRHQEDADALTLALHALKNAMREEDWRVMKLAFDAVIAALQRILPDLDRAAGD